MRLVDAPPQDGIGLGQLHAVVDPHRLIGVGHRQGPHRQPLGAGDLEHVGQIVFPLGVVAADGAQRFENQRRLKSVDTRIDLVDGLLLGGGVLLFDDAQHRLAVTDNAPVAVGIGHLGGKDGDRRLLFGMVGKKALQGLATQERHVAAQEKQGAGKVAQFVGGAEQGMAGAELLGLHGKAHRLIRKRPAYLFGAVADDQHRLLTVQFPAKADGEIDHRLAGHRVQHLGQGRFHPRPLPRRENDRRQLLSAHKPS